MISRDLGEVIDIIIVPGSIPEKTTFCYEETCSMIAESRSIYF